MTAEHEPNRSLELKDTWDGPWPATRAVPMSFFRSPLVNNIDELDADVAFLGVPYDQGTYARPGARFGPNGIRYVNRIYDYMDAFEDKEAQGYFDIDRREMMLRGVTMADCGDVTIIRRRREQLRQDHPRSEADCGAGVVPGDCRGRPLDHLSRSAGVRQLCRPGRGPLRCAHRLQPRAPGHLLSPRLPDTPLFRPAEREEHNVAGHTHGSARRVRGRHSQGRQDCHDRPVPGHGPRGGDRPKYPAGGKVY